VITNFKSYKHLDKSETDRGSRTMFYPSGLCPVLSDNVCLLWTLSA
jgi:hypothetical protein